MTDLVKALAEARERYPNWATDPAHAGGRAGIAIAAAIAREIVAEKESEIARLKAQLAASFKANGELALENEARRIRLRGLGLDTEMDTE